MFFLGFYFILSCAACGIMATPPSLSHGFAKRLTETGLQRQGITVLAGTMPMRHAEVP